MSRLIDADAVQMQIDEYAEHIRRLKKGKIPKVELAVLLDCKGCVDNTPTVDAVPVVHGRWRYISGSRYVCSLCGCEPWYGGSIRTLYYCPACGARMDEQ